MTSSFVHFVRRFCLSPSLHDYALPKDRVYCWEHQGPKYLVDL
jgi:hypothetical protein